MLQFIHDNFKVDLSHLSVSFNEQNQLFNDQFTRELSFPFQIDLTREFARNPDFDAHYNASRPVTIYMGKLDRDGVVSDAELVIESAKGKFAEAVIRSGLENFPNFSKKLSELPLENFPVDDIVAHAMTIIPQSYPAVNYNFRMIHTDKYNGDETFPGFEKIINNYRNGGFLLNELGFEADVIRNIMQPFAYVMHVLKVAVEDAGYNLSGDILTDPEILQALFFKDASYYQNNTLQLLSMFIGITEYYEIAYTLHGFVHVRYSKDVVIERRGNYEFSGNMYFAWVSTIFSTQRVTNMFLWVKRIRAGVETFILNFALPEGYNTPTALHVFQSAFSVAVSDLQAGDIIRVYKEEVRRDQGGDLSEQYPFVFEMDIIPIRYLDEDGNPYLTVSNLNKVDLPMVVPDITVEDMITWIKNSKNYRFDIVGNLAVMNKIKPQIDRSTALLLPTEIEEPKRSFSEDRSYELLFQDGEANKDYPYDSAYISSAGVAINVYTKKETTKVISIDALPLPVITRNGIKTAYALDDETSKTRLIFARSMLSDSIPTTYLNTNFLIPQLLQQNFLEWLNFRISSVAWEWDFLIPVERFRDITVQSLIYAYDNYHLFTELEKERVDLLWWRVTARTESLI